MAQAWTTPVCRASVVLGKMRRRSHPAGRRPHRASSRSLGENPRLRECSGVAPGRRAHRRSAGQELRAEVAPDLLEECGVRPVCAAQLLVSNGNPNRMASEGSFAVLAGTSPVDASSDRQHRHRQNRGGDRQPNRAQHIIALARIHHRREAVRLLSAAARDGQDQDRPRGTPLRQASTRPLLLPPTTRDANTRLDNIEASNCTPRGSEAI
jgi:Transposase IS116/IS110/IS902 family